MSDLSPPLGAPSYFSLPDEPQLSLSRRALSGGVVAAVHLLLVFGLGYAASHPEIQQPIRALAVRLIEPAAPVVPKVEPPKPLPPQAAPRKAVVPPPVMAVTTPASTPSSFTVAPQPAPVVAAPVAAPVVAPVTAARFDADYLQNPKPVYPPMSRRLGEEGKVVLRVRVSAQGLPLAIEIRQSSGYARLDDAARVAVEQWRFVPAKQGAEPVESSVLVPLNFTLSN